MPSRSHLVTREALAVYLQHIKPDGAVAFHVTSRLFESGAGDQAAGG